MARKPDAAGAALMAFLAGDSTARLVAVGDGRFALRVGGRGRAGQLPEAAVKRHAAAGLLAEVEPGVYAATSAAAAWLKRRTLPDMPFRAQHGTVVGQRSKSGPKSGGAEVFVNLDESPVAALARRVGKGGEPWLRPHALEAAERLRRDFEIGRLQPRVTANWSASVSTGRRAGDGGLTDLTDMALAARLRVDRATAAVGPELSGVLVDVCCFLKGLETVEREHQWPARSAKLVLRIALESLARHYGLTATATGRPGSGKLRHWGTDDYRPEIA